MSRKRPPILPAQMLEICLQICPETSFTDGSIEALRVCQTNFLEQVSEELVALDKFSYTPKDVFDALTKMGLSEIADEALRRTEGEKQAPTKAQAKKIRRRKAVKWSQEMEDEQERMLAQTKKEMEEQHGEIGGCSILEE
jgi:hypothetical protein